MGGYLWLLLVVFLTLAVIVLLRLAVKKSYPRSYKPKGYFLLSPGEQKYFDALVQSVPEDMYICPNVREGG